MILLKLERHAATEASEVDVGTHGQQQGQIRHCSSKLDGLHESTSILNTVSFIYF